MSVPNWLLNLIPERGTFRSDTSYLVATTAVGIAIAAVLSPFLTRLYSPTDFGVFAVYGSLLGISVAVASLRYESAIPIARTEEEAATIRKLSYGIVTTLAVGFALVALGLGAVGADPVPAAAAYSLVGAFAAGGFSQVLVASGVRANHFAAIGRMRVVQPSATGTLQLLVGGLSTFGLILGDVVGRWIGTLVLAVGQRSILKIGGLSWNGIKEVAYRYRRFPLAAAPASLSNAAGLYAPALLLARFYGLGAAGLFDLAHRLLGLAAVFIGRSVSQVYAGRTSGFIRTGQFDELSNLTTAVARRLALVLIVPFAVVALVAPAVFGWLFGDDWIQAGEMARLLAPAYFAQVVVAPLSPTLNLLELQPRQLAWDLARFVGVIAAMAVPAALGQGALPAIAALSLVQIVAYTILFGVIVSSISSRGTREAA